MNLTARMPSIVSSSTSSNPVKIWYGFQDPGILLWKMIDQGNLMDSPPTSYSKMDYGRSWSSARVEK